MLFIEFYSCIRFPKVSRFGQLFLPSSTKSFPFWITRIECKDIKLPIYLPNVSPKKFYKKIKKVIYLAYS